MIRWIANVIFVIVAVALAIFFLRIEAVDGSVSIRLRDAQERAALWRSITGQSSASPVGKPDKQGPSADSAESTQPAKPDAHEPTDPEPRPTPGAVKPSKKSDKPVEKDLDRKGLDNLIEKSL